MSKRIVDYCIDIATNNKNKPMHVEKIYAQMRRRHWKTTGKTPKQTISYTLNKDYRFNRISSNTFVLDEKFYKARAKRA